VRVKLVLGFLLAAAIGVVGGLSYRKTRTVRLPDCTATRAPTSLILFCGGIMQKQKWLVMFALAAQQTAWSGDWQERLELANAHLRSGRLAEAEALYRGAESEATAEKRAIVLSNLGVIAYSRARFAEAERLYKRALAGGLPSTDSAVTWGNLGAALAAQGSIVEADAAYARALALTSGDSRVAGNVLNNRAELYRRAGRLEDAEQAARAALAVAEKHPADRRALASRVHTLATILAERGQLQDALELLERSRDLKIAEGLKDDNETAATASATAQVLLLLGKHAEAETLANESLAMWRRIYGPAHPRTAVGLELLASIYSAKGQRAEADPLYREALAICEATLGGSNPETARIRVSFAEHLRRLGRERAAIGVYTDALRAYQHAFGIDSPRVVTVKAAIANTYRRLGRHTEAVSMERTSAAAATYR
jgi:tetratricopeptide (TPR) repeat protein